MGIQSTIELTREEAENKWIAKKEKELRCVLKSQVVLLKDIDLENMLDEEFHNYTIKKVY